MDQLWLALIVFAAFVIRDLYLNIRGRSVLDKTFNDKFDEIYDNAYEEGYGNAVYDIAKIWNDNVNNDLNLINGIYEFIIQHGGVKKY